MSNLLTEIMSTFEKTALTRVRWIPAVDARDKREDQASGTAIRVTPDVLMASTTKAFASFSDNAQETFCETAGTPYKLVGDYLVDLDDFNNTSFENGIIYFTAGDLQIQDGVRKYVSTSASLYYPEEAGEVEWTLVLLKNGVQIPGAIAGFSSIGENTSSASVITSVYIIPGDSLEARIVSSVSGTYPIISSTQTGIFG